MNKTEKFEFSKAQNILLLIISVIFVVIIWRMIPLDNMLKVMLCCFLGGFILQIVVTFANYLRYLSVVSSPKAAIFITIVVFIAFPLFISILHSTHEKEYLSSYPVDNQISVKITYDIDYIGGSGSIGNEWTYEHYLDDEEFENGDVIIVNAKTPFTIKSRFIERDGINDVGETISSQYRYSDNDNYKKTLTISQKVHVVEQGGRKYAGSTADFKATYKLERVVPESMGYLDIFLYTSNDAEYYLCMLLICGQILCAVFVIFVLITGRNKLIYAEEQEKIKATQKLEEERQRKEREFLEGKKAFIESLKGQSIRQAAGVPTNIAFVNGLPKDDNNSEYGSFTVYCTNNGSCYHDKKGCCSARRPMHYFDAKKKFRPCSKCCTKKRSIPKWYIDYVNIKNKAKYYKIEIIE